MVRALARGQKGDVMGMCSGTFEAWKSEVQAEVAKCPDLALEPIWGDDDPYDLCEAAAAAFAAGQEPGAFIREMFADELASCEHDRLVGQEADEVEEC
jgi:hypothetical protein